MVSMGTSVPHACKFLCRAKFFDTKNDIRDVGSTADLVLVFLVLMIIPDICHFFYTNTFLDQKILHSKVRKFATKIASRQNSVNF